MLQDRLVAAAGAGDVAAATAVIAQGAHVNTKGTAPSWRWPVLPLYAAVAARQYDAASTLLKHGADPNGDCVMHVCCRHGTPEILQLLVAMGGDVNRESGGWRPLFVVIGVHGGGDAGGKLRVLLATAALDLTATHDHKTPEQYARFWDRDDLADAIATEVRPP